MKRDILIIDEDLCNGCGQCIPSCHEGAIQIINGKAKLVSEFMCDGLGACVGHCPEGAITIESREAEPYNEAKVKEIQSVSGHQPSELRQWPVQMHLINPDASYFKDSDLLLAADCTAFSLGNFHNKHLKGKTLAIACPKLDHGSEIYIEKLTALIDRSKINTITVMMMEVPCCGGLLRMVIAALAKASRKIPVKKLVAGINGEILLEEWI